MIFPLALQITREKKKKDLPGGCIPPIVPIVIYNGLQAWNVATDAADCFIEPPGGLEGFLPRLRYLLLDAHRLKMNRSKKIENFAEAVFRMETSNGKEDVFTVLKALADTLKAPELKSLRRALNVWVKGLLQRHERDTKIRETIAGINDIFEDIDMAEATYEIWSETIRKNIENTTRKKFLSEGEKKGRKEGEAKLLVRLLSRRFGPLPKWAETRVNKAKSAQLEKWADAVLDASSLTEVLGPSA